MSGREGTRSSSAVETHQPPLGPTLAFPSTQNCLLSDNKHRLLTLHLQEENRCSQKIGFPTHTGEHGFAQAQMGKNLLNFHKKVVCVCGCVFKGPCIWI